MLGAGWSSIFGCPVLHVSNKNSLQLRTVSLIPKYFCAVYDCAGKADLSKGYWNPKRKLGVTTHFLEIIIFNIIFRIIIILKSSKIQSNVWRSFQNLKLYYL